MPLSAQTLKAASKGAVIGFAGASVLPSLVRGLVLLRGNASDPTETGEILSEPRGWPVERGTPTRVGAATREGLHNCIARIELDDLG
jgi:hypothetical protein